MEGRKVAKSGEVQTGRWFEVLGVIGIGKGKRKGCAGYAKEERKRGSIFEKNV